jgi:hypothetical protein
MLKGMRKPTVGGGEAAAAKTAAKAVLAFKKHLFSDAAVSLQDQASVASSNLLRKAMSDWPAGRKPDLAG